MKIHNQLGHCRHFDPHLSPFLPQTVNALIVDHLRLCGFNFTLSLFLPESGLASVDEARYSLRTGLADRAEEILDERLHERPEDSLLLKLMEPMTRMGWLREAEMKGRRGPSASTVEVETQTERGKETDGVTGRLSLSRLGIFIYTDATINTDATIVIDSTSGP